jgi:hypothetical protein
VVGLWAGLGLFVSLAGLETVGAASATLGFEVGFVLTAVLYLALTALRHRPKPV